MTTQRGIGGVSGVGDSLGSASVEGLSSSCEVGELGFRGCQVQHPESAIGRRHQALGVDVRSGLIETVAYLFDRFNASLGYGDQPEDDRAPLE